MAALSFSISLLLLVVSAVCPASADPSISVSLEASFTSPPYLIELLETSALENATAFYPVLSAIASGRFAAAVSDEHLFKQFSDFLIEHGHLRDPAALSSWRMALAVREAAPRIAAHYQYYTSVFGEGDAHSGSTAVEVWKDGVRCMDPDCTVDAHVVADRSFGEMDIDRLSGPSSPGAAKWVMYADPSAANFTHEYSLWERSLQGIGSSWIVRYKPCFRDARPLLPVSGFGVELTLKRTDYIVIDDRSADQSQQGNAAETITLDEPREIADLAPLSSSELYDLGFRTASFIMSESDKMAALRKVTQDFPRHAAALAKAEKLDGFVKEHQRNRERFLPPGFNAMWMNGMNIETSEVDAFMLLERMRRERSLLDEMKILGLNATEAINLLSHSRLTEAQISADQRYDWRDDTEDGIAIVWLNNLEKDKRYAHWPSNTNALMQRMYPGQLPAVRKDIHNVIFPIDFNDGQDISIVVGTLQDFVKRELPVRFGIVPSILGQGSLEQAKIVYHLADTYGLSAVIDYLQQYLAAGRYTTAATSIFDRVTQNRTTRRTELRLAYDEAVQDGKTIDRTKAATKYLNRLAARHSKAPIFVNGVAVPRHNEWMMAVSQRLSVDLRTVQRALFEEVIEEKTWIAGHLLEGASLRRNPLIIPEDEKDIKLMKMPKMDINHASQANQPILFQLPSDEADANMSRLFVLADLNTQYGFDLLMNSLAFAIKQANVAVLILHTGTTLVREDWKARKAQWDFDSILGDFIPSKTFAEDYLLNEVEEKLASTRYDASYPLALMEDLGVPAGQSGLVLNGRLIVLPKMHSFTYEDLEALYDFEYRKRVQPVLKAMLDLGLGNKLKQSPMILARLSSLVAVSQIPAVPEGVFETTPGPRIDLYNLWQTQYSCIEIGDRNAAVIYLVASIDPTSELAQRWVPILSALSQLDGVYLRIFVNPKERLAELPVKRFYRYVLEPKPRFNNKGGVQGTTADFSALPESALLTLSLDVPSSWLVAPRESVHDLDNIKLSSLKSASTIEATYSLEAILIEGHSRDTSTGAPPRGVQLRLEESGLDEAAAGTIVMANLGYFQFKAGPGVYQLALEGGNSRRIFKLDSAGQMRLEPSRTSRNATQVILASFNGATLFPSLSRKPGQEQEDVLDLGNSATMNGFVSKGVQLVDEVLARSGVTGLTASGMLSKGISIGQKLLPDKIRSRLVQTHQTGRHADINIFTVASGHLYERMLNIMIVSVMRHTEHTVKFWFIEQFLSPSFKRFLPILAAEYGFSYEMVAYKWPHWLRSQKEKQRTIWGYKILFLDVLFPLDLDKVIFVDADQIVRTDMYELVTHDLKGAPYGFTPMCDSRTEMEGFRFWKQGYWKNFLRGLPYHISALYVVDLRAFRQMAAGDRLRGQYHQLSADPGSLSNLDQDLPNHMQMVLPIHSLPQEWLWCETWCSDESLKDAKTIDLCNNPQTKEPKLDRARRQVPEWTVYDDEIAALARRTKIDAAQVADSNVQAEEMGETVQGSSDAPKPAAGDRDNPKHTSRIGRDEL